ncbi:glucose-1-phosphate thymidylyltransferase [Opitutales bacterium ASA1]|uniref:acyltransferase n=1 Tax=Congregicoccus parvus TaxID=3081749 RepID=UPI002B2DD78C|nr:glucose-1-phosphate thymidylyltransferase [Opitutales bacterium ASA1]
MQAAELFQLPPSLARFAEHFAPEAAPWAWVGRIGAALAGLELVPDASLPIPAGVAIEGAVFLHASVKLPHTCTIQGPAWIGPGTEIRPGAFIRGNVIVGAGCVLGNSCEFKNSLLMDGVQVPHFSYVGDSILGNKSHLGAGVICSNLRLDQKPVTIRMTDGAVVDTGMRKLGAMLGDAAEAGCNAVLQPGAILGRRAVVFPLTPFAGVAPANTIAKVRSSAPQFFPRRD